MTLGELIESAIAREAPGARSGVRLWHQTRRLAGTNHWLSRSVPYYTAEFYRKRGQIPNASRDYAIGEAP